MVILYLGGKIRRLKSSNKSKEKKEHINKKAVKEIEKIINVFLKEGKKRNAPVFEFENFKNDFEALIKIILSSRTKDETTIKATKKLFSIINSPKQLAELDEKKIEEAIYGVAFYRNKAKLLKKLSKILIEKYNGSVPKNFRDLVELPGVGAKTANVFIGSFLKGDAIGVDVHVHRISNRLGIVRTKKEIETEKKLREIIPKKYWRLINKAFVAYGQTVCKAKPLCNECRIRYLCKYGSGERI